MSLPDELHLRIFRFAVVEPCALPLIVIRHWEDPISERAIGYGVEKDLRMFNTCKEFRIEMSRLLYSENRFSLSVAVRRGGLEDGDVFEDRNVFGDKSESEDESESGDGAESGDVAESKDEAESGDGAESGYEPDAEIYRVDLQRIQKCHFIIGNVTGSPYDSPSERDDLFIDEWDFLADFQFFVHTLFESHQMKYLLVECESQACEFLALGFCPLSMLRNIRLVQLRSSQPEMYLFFSFIEHLMMGDWPVPYDEMKDFWEFSNYDDDLLEHPDQSWLVDGLQLQQIVVGKSDEEMEADAKELYSTLEVEGGFIPLSELDEKRFSSEFVP